DVPRCERRKEHDRRGRQHEHLRAQRGAAPLDDEAPPGGGEAEGRVIQHDAGGAADEKERRLPPRDRGTEVNGAENERSNGDADRSGVERTRLPNPEPAIEGVRRIRHRTGPPATTPPTRVILIDPFNSSSGVFEPTTNGSIVIMVRSASRPGASMPPSRSPHPPYSPHVL